jgi:quercetin dioxygenase-like cupin family protein
MKTYPYTIENGAGEQLTFCGVVRDDNKGERLEAESRAQPGVGPVMHVHLMQEEVMVVKSGKVGYQIFGQEPRFASEGETAHFAPGVAHRWWNAGTTELRCTGWVKPPLNFEYFLTAIYESMKRNGGGRPDLFDVAFLLTRYRSEFGMIEIPMFVQRAFFPVLVAVGTALGKYRKFKDAPQPAK